MTFFSSIERVDPSDVNLESAALNSWLDYERATLLMKLQGLTDERAAQRTVASDTTLHGIVRHLTTIEGRTLAGRSRSSARLVRLSAGLRGRLGHRQIAGLTAEKNLPA